MTLTRRAFALGTVSSLLVAEAAAQVAARALIPFGSAVMVSDFRSDAMLRDQLVKLCDVIVPMNELKWQSLRPDADTFSFRDADEIIQFAQRNRKKIHGHTFLWGDFLPDWASRLNSARDAERALVKHIETVAAKYAGIVSSWDVANEVIAHDATPEKPFRDSVWFRQLGPRLVDIAFQTAARVDPAARLVLNDYDFENPDERTAERRRQALRLVRHLQDRKIPIHEVGLQAHLYGEKPLDLRAITAFCRELGRLGVGVRVTELDVIDWKLPGPAGQRDKLIADLTSAFLGAVIEGQRPEVITTWGLSDKSSWIHDVFKRQDSMRARPLPLDENYRPKPMMAAIEAARRLPKPAL